MSDAVRKRSTKEIERGRVQAKSRSKPSSWKRFFFKETACLIFLAPGSFEAILSVSETKGILEMRYTGKCNEMGVDVRRGGSCEREL